MSNIRKVKIESVLSSQIPRFLEADSPLFKEFLTQYYISQTHSTGTLDFANNLSDYKNIETYASERLYTTNNVCTLTEDILAFDDEIKVNSTTGFPDKYGLIQIDDEIITYTGITTNTFTGCVRGFSGVSQIDDTPDISGLVFSITVSEEHSKFTVVKNLNLVFYQKLFDKFKAHYLPDFENREFSSKIDLELILTRARDFYLSKGTDISFQILFEILYADKVSIIKPQEYVIRSSDNQRLVTKNILVEPLIGNFNSSEIIGNTIYQDLPSGVTASASIYNVEFRPVDDFNLYEISLDSESFIYTFTPTKKTIIIEKLTDSLIVDSTIGFPEYGKLYVKNKNFDGTFTINTISYSGKTINQFLNVTTSSDVSSGDEIIENNLLQVILDDASIIQFRLINVIENFDFTTTNTIQNNDMIYLSSFGENFTDKPEFSSWIYNYSTYHEIKSISSNIIELKDYVKFTIGDEVELLDAYNNSTLSSVIDIIDSNRIQINIIPDSDKIKLKKRISKSSLNFSSCANIQNSYLNESKNSVIISSSGLPVSSEVNKLNPYTYNLVGVGNTFTTRNLDNSQVIEHNLLSGNKIHISSLNTGISTGQYYVKKINNTKISLYQSSGDLYLSFANNPTLVSFSNPVSILTVSPNNIIGIATLSGYHEVDNEFSNQLLLKEFNVEDSFYRNKVTSDNQIYNIEDAYSAFS